MKKNDSLENFIRRNKQEFDRFVPSEEIWAKLENALDEKKQPKVITLTYTTLWRAAAVVLLLMGVTVLWRYAGFRGQESKVAIKNIDLKKINPELAEVEIYYTSLIAQKNDEIKKFTDADPELSRDFSKELASLDSMYVKLKEELATLPAKEKVMDAMILNLQLRIQVLNQQLAILEKIRNLKKEKPHESKNI